jgi:hypothetical protein
MDQKPDISSSGAAKAEADPAYVNLKVKQQVFVYRLHRMLRTSINFSAVGRSYHPFQN